MTEKSEELQELERRIVADIKGSYNETEYDQGLIAGLKVAWYEIKALDEPYVGRDSNDQM